MLENLLYKGQIIMYKNILYEVTSTPHINVAFLYVLKEKGTGYYGTSRIRLSKGQVKKKFKDRSIVIGESIELLYE